MPTLRETSLVKVSVEPGATFLDAARALFEARISAIAVVGSEGRVVGLFTDDDLLRGLFPGYLGELRHTAFLHAELDVLTARLGQVADEPVQRHMRPAMAVDIDTSAIHVAERFLHCAWGALAVVQNGAFVGMVEQVRFVEALMRRLSLHSP